MNIIDQLLKAFFTEEWITTSLMISTSLLINVLQTNGISFITANIIQSIQKHNQTATLQFYKYFILVAILYAVLQYFYKNFQTYLLTKLRQWIRFQLVRALILTNNENFSEANFAKLSSPINRLSSTSFAVFNDMITYLLPNATFLLIVGAYFLYQNVWYGLIFVIGNLLVFAFLSYTWNDMKDRNEKYEQQVNESESYLVEILNNMDKIVYRGQTDQEITIFSEKKDKSIQKAYEFYGATDRYCSIMGFIVTLTIFFGIGYLIYMFYSKQISLTLFMTFITITLLYRDKMTVLIQQLPDFLEFMGRTESVMVHFKDLDHFDEINKTYALVEVPFEHISLQGVSFKYKGGEQPVFQDLNLELNTTGNKIIGITGLSGRGKSTFMKMVLKMYPCNEGAIFIDGHDIGTIDGNYIRKHITYVNQNSKLFDRKIIENIMYGCSDADACKTYYDEIITYPKIVELYRNVDINETKVGSLGEKLSGGQRQVVNLISGLINPSKILILDEPTNALDPALKAEVLTLIKHFKKHKQCILIITHDQEVYELFDETIEL